MFQFILYEIRHLAPLVFKATLNLRQLSSDWLPHSERKFKQEMGGALMTILGMHAITNIIKRNCRKLSVLSRLKPTLLAHRGYFYTC